jgi:hypothetical protein
MYLFVENKKFALCDSSKAQKIQIGDLVGLQYINPLYPHEKKFAEVTKIEIERGRIFAHLREDIINIEPDYWASPF